MSLKESEDMLNVAFFVVLMTMLAMLTIGPILV